MNQEYASQDSFAPVSDDQLAVLTLETAQYQHAWLRDVAHERLALNVAHKRHAAVEILEAFISTITGKPVPKVSRNTVDRIAGLEDMPHPKAALRK